MDFSRTELDNWLNIAEEAALSSGNFLLKNVNSNLGRKVEYSTGRDIKISADKLSEDIIIEILKKTNFSILTEESGLLVDKGIYESEDLKWIVDPLDGSLNYFRKIPLCCVSIGLWANRKPILGVVYDFNSKNLFSGISQACSWLNKEKIKPSKVCKINQAILCTGFPINTDFSAQALNKFVEKVHAYKKIRLLGSAALSLAYVATGLVDAYMENGIMFWDIAGGLSILDGVGGKYTLEAAKKEHSFDVFASTPYLEA
jgi:myo-inositol-1(or 4)-monophosphatase